MLIFFYILSSRECVQEANVAVKLQPSPVPSYRIGLHFLSFFKLRN